VARYINLESAILLVVCLAIPLGLCLFLGLPPIRAIGISAVLTLLVFFPLATLMQDKLLEMYADRGQLDRALDLALKIRDSAPNQRFRNRAAVDVALVQVLKRDYANALTNLESVKLSLIRAPEARAVVEGHIGYCLAHLDKDLPRAEELARAALKSVPNEPLFHYFIGLALLKQNKPAEAEPEIAKSLAENPDPKAPYPGERAYHLALARKSTGGDVEGPKGQAVAAGGEFAERAKAI
jgi:tetratricopeptide (TPR) repeat protein